MCQNDPDFELSQVQKIYIVSKQFYLIKDVLEYQIQIRIAQEIAIMNDECIWWLVVGSTALVVSKATPMNLNSLIVQL